MIFERDLFHPVMNARIKGVTKLTKCFDFLFSCKLGGFVLSITDNLSATLQSPKVSAAQGFEMAFQVLDTLARCRDEEHFTTFWESVLKEKKEVK